MSVTRRFVAFAVVGAGLLPLVSAPAFAGELTLTAPKAEAPAGGESVVSLRAKVDADTSALQGGLSYDAALVDIVEVTAGGALPEGARVDYNADQPGWLRLGFVCSPSKGSFRGEGEVLRIKVRTKGAVGAEGALRLSRVRAWEPNDAEHRTTTVDGALRIVAAKSLPWVPLAAGVGLLLLILLVVKRRRRSPSADRPRAPAPVPSTDLRPTGGRGRFCTSCGTPMTVASSRFCGACGTPVA